MSTKVVAMAAIGLSALALPASAQIIATSIPREEVAGKGKGVTGAEKKFALHLMVTPLAKWKYGEFAAGVCPAGVCAQDILDYGVFTGTPNSKFLFAGEVVFKAARDWTVGVGGWYNKVGSVNYNFDVQSIYLSSGRQGHETGTLDGDLNVSEGHASIFYKDFGLQAGIVHTNSAIANSRIVTDSLNQKNVGQPLGSIDPSSNSANDWDLYGVYKFSGGSKQPWGISLGAGFYKKKGNTVNAQRPAQDKTVFSGFVTGSVDIYKGLGLDASFWYVGKTEAAIGGTTLASSPAQSRFTLGVGYTFSR
jgi:hypothetical protein